MVFLADSKPDTASSEWHPPDKSHPFAVPGNAEEPSPPGGSSLHAFPGTEKVDQRKYLNLIKING